MYLESRWLLLGAVLAGCGGSSTGGIGVVHLDGGSGDGTDSGTSTPLGEACTATVTGAIVVTFSCVVSHTSTGGDFLLFEADPRVPVKGMSSFYGSLQAKTSFSPGTYAPTAFASAVTTLTTSDGTKWSASATHLTLQALSPATPTATYDTGDQGSLDANLTSSAGGSASLHIAF